MKYLLTGIITFFATLSSLHLYDDIDAYYTNLNHSGCCGWVDKNPLKRPFTYLMVEKWSEPKWTINASGDEEWLVIEGYVDGERNFWTILEYKDPETKKPLAYRD